MGTSINKVANEVYKVLSSVYKVETFNSDGNRVYDYDEARNFYCNPGKIIVSILENGDRHTIDVKLSKSTDIRDFEKNTGQKLRKVATRNTNVSYNIRSYGREIKPKEESTMNIENVQEAMYGTTRSSYQKVGECKVIIRHSGRVNEDKHGARSRHISAIFVETKNGERFKIAENNLHGARAMARHLSNGGSPFDTVGMKMTTMMSEMNELKGMILEARTITRGAITEQSISLIEQMRTKFLSIRESLKRMSGKVGYFRTASSLTEGTLNEHSLSTYIYNNETDTEYDVEVEYEFTSGAPQTRTDPEEHSEIQIITAIEVNTGKDMRELLTADDEERIESEIMDHESSEHEARADYEYDLRKDNMHDEGINEEKFSTTFHSDKTDTLYNISFDYIIKPSLRNEGKFIIDIRNLMNDENVEMKSMLSSDDIKDLKMEVIEHLRQKHSEKKVAVGEEIVKEYRPAGGMQDLSQPWKDKTKWGEAVLTFIARNKDIHTSKADVLSRLGLDQDAHMAFMDYVSKKEMGNNMREDIINEYNPAGGYQDLSTPWDDRDAWADSVLTFINRKIKLSTVRKPEYQHTQASALKLLDMSDETRDEFLNIIASRKANEGIDENQMEFVSPLQRLGLMMSDALDNPAKYNLEGAFAPGPEDNGKMTDAMHERFNQMSSAIYKLENNDKLTHDEHKLALKFHNHTKNMKIADESIEMTEEAKLDTTKKVAGDQTVEINDVKIEDDASEQVQDMADFARDKQSAGNYADVDDLFSVNEIKENAILEAWFDEAANIQFFNEEELIIEEEPAPVIEKTLPNTALHQLNLHMGNPLFNDLIAMYEGQGILDKVTELVEDDSKLKDEMMMSRSRLREFHEMGEMSDAFKLLNELVSKNKMGTDDAIHTAAKKYSKEYHDGDKLAYEQASEALRQMATEQGIIHADAGRTFADDVMSHSDEIRKHKDEIEAEEFYGDAHFEDMEEKMEDRGSEEITEMPSEPMDDHKPKFEESAPKMDGNAIQKDLARQSKFYQDREDDFDDIARGPDEDELDEASDQHVFASTKDAGDDNKEQLDKDVCGPYIGEDDESVDENRTMEDTHLTRMRELAGISDQVESIGRPQHTDQFSAIEPHELEFMDDEGNYIDQEDQAKDQHRMNPTSKIVKVKEYNKYDDEDEWGTKKDYDSKYGKKQKRREMRKKKEYKRTDHMDEQDTFNSRVIELSKYKT